jgi:hypothetical protein
MAMKMIKKLVAMVRDGLIVEDETGARFKLVKAWPYRHRIAGALTQDGELGVMYQQMRPWLSADEEHNRANQIIWEEAQRVLSDLGYIAPEDADMRRTKIIEGIERTIARLQEA